MYVTATYRKDKQYAIRIVKINSQRADGSNFTDGRENSLNNSTFCKTFRFVHFILSISHQ